MTIDISNILGEEKGVVSNFKGEVSYKDTVYQGDKISFSNPIAVNGNLSKGRDCLYIMINIRGNITIPCSRCAGEFSHEIDLSFTEEFKDIDDVVGEEELDVYTYQGTKIKLDRIIFEQILLNMPIKRLCKIDCMGLCPKCGIDLNEQKCNCDRDDDIDIRLLELKKLLPSKDREV